MPLVYETAGRFFVHHPVQGTYMRCRDIRLITSCSDMRGCMGRCRHRLGPNWISWSYTTSLGTLNRKTHELNVMSHNRGKHTKEEGKMKNEEEGRRKEKKKKGRRRSRWWHSEIREKFAAYSHKPHCNPA